MRSVAKTVQLLDKHYFFKSAINGFFSIVNKKMREMAVVKTGNNVFEISLGAVDRKMNVRNRTGLIRRFERAWNFDNAIVPKSVIEYNGFLNSNRLVSKLFHFFSSPEAKVQMFDCRFGYNPRCTRISSFDEYANVSDSEFGLMMCSVILDILPFVYRSLAAKMRESLDFLGDDYEITFSKFFGDQKSLITKNIKEIIWSHGEKEVEISGLMPYVFNPYVEIWTTDNPYAYSRYPIHFRTRDTINPGKILQNTFGSVVYPYSGICAFHYEEILGKGGIAKMETREMIPSALSSTEMQFVPSNAGAYKNADEYPRCSFSDVLPDGYIPPFIILGNVFNSLLVKVTKKDTGEMMYIHFDEKGENPVFLENVKNCKFMYRHMRGLIIPGKDEYARKEALEEEESKAYDALSQEFSEFHYIKGHLIQEVQNQINERLLLALRDNIRKDKMLRTFARYFKFPAALFRVKFVSDDFRVSHDKIVCKLSNPEDAGILKKESWLSDGNPVYRLSLQYTRKRILRDLVRNPYSYTWDHDLNYETINGFQFQNLVYLLRRDVKIYRAKFENMLGRLGDFIHYLCNNIPTEDRKDILLGSRYHKDLVESMLNYFLSEYGTDIIESTWNQFQDALTFRKNNPEIERRVIDAAARLRKAERELRKAEDSPFMISMHGTNREIPGIGLQIEMMQNIKVQFNLIELKRDTRLV